MSTVHETVNWTAGDDWQIRATLIDDTGTPFNLSGAPPIKWALINSDGLRALDETDTTVSIIDGVNGKCEIHIAAAKSAPLPGGRYSDMIRIVYGGMTSTLSYGPIDVAANPWTAAEVAATGAQMLRVV